MKVFMANINKAKAKKRGIAKGGAPQAMIAIAKKPWVVLGGPSVSSKALAACLPRSPATEDDDDNVEVISAPIPIVLVSFLVPTISVTILVKLNTSIRAGIDGRVKAPMTLAKLKESPQEEEYLHIGPRVLKDALAIKSKSLVERMWRWSSYHKIERTGRNDQ